MNWMVILFSMITQTMTRHSKNSKSQYKYKNTCQEEQKSVHSYSTPLLSIVAITKAETKIVNPTAKILTRNSTCEINWPITKVANTNFPISYKALASSLRCVLSRLITILSITTILLCVKGFLYKFREWEETSYSPQHK